MNMSLTAHVEPGEECMMQALRVSEHFIVSAEWSPQVSIMSNGSEFPYSLAHQAPPTIDSLELLTLLETYPYLVRENRQ